MKSNSISVLFCLFVFHSSIVGVFLNECLSAYKISNAVDFNVHSRGGKSIVQVSEHILPSPLSNWKTTKKINQKSKPYNTKYIYITHSSYLKAMFLCTF